LVCVGSAGQHRPIVHDVMVPVQSSGAAAITSLFPGDPYGIGQSLDGRVMAPNVPLVNSTANGDSPPASCRCPDAMFAPVGPFVWHASSGEGEPRLVGFRMREALIRCRFSTNHFGLRFRAARRPMCVKQLRAGCTWLGGTKLETLNRPSWSSIVCWEMTVLRRYVASTSLSRVSAIHEFAYSSSGPISRNYQCGAWDASA
jgi:hypothetical protein